MKYNFGEILISILDVFIFNNPIGMTSVIISFLSSVLMCIYGNKKSRTIYVSSLFAVTIFSVFICICGNSPDYLFLPIFFFPFFTMTLIVFVVYNFIRILIHIEQGSNND